MSAMDLLYTSILPVMKKRGIEDTIKNRQAFLIGVREAYGKVKNPELVDFDGFVMETLTEEIIRLGDEIPVYEEE